jgi:hypothetical protein
MRNGMSMRRFGYRDLQKLGLDPAGCPPGHGAPPMDFSKLEVGQNVRVYAGYGERYDGEGGPAKVVLVTESYVEVEFPQPGGPIGLPYRMRFDIKGAAMDSRDIYLGDMDDRGLPQSVAHETWQLIDEEELQRMEDRWAKFTQRYPYPPAHPLLSSLRRFLRRWVK